MRQFILVCFLAATSFLNAQRGKTGTVTISSATTVVNDYTSLLQNANAGSI